MSIIDDEPQPQGRLELRTITTPAITNSFGDIYGGWVIAQMDQAAAAAATQVAGGRVVTVSISKTDFMVAVEMGAIISCYCEIIAVGRSSIDVGVDVWASYPESGESSKVTEGRCIFVAVDRQGLTRQIGD